MIKLVAFDWNGTLLADTQTVVDCTNLEIKFYGLKPQTIKEYRETFIIPVNKYFINIGANPKKVEKNYKTYSKLFHTQYEKKVNKLRTRSGTRQLLEFLKNKNIKSVIFSNHSTPRIKEQCDRLKLTTFLDDILGNYNAHDAYTLRSKEMRLASYMKRNKINSTETLIVGDTDEEIIIGRDMGAKTAGITGGHNSTKRLKAEMPDYLITNLLEIKKILANFK